MLILDADQRLVATGSRVGSLYYLDLANQSQHANLVSVQGKEDIWHRRFGYLGVGSLQNLQGRKRWNGFDFDLTKLISLKG